jgi:hypothetical protein
MNDKLAEMRDLNRAWNRMKDEKAARAKEELEEVREERDAYARRLERRDVQVKGLVEGIETAWARIDKQGELIDELERTILWGEKTDESIGLCRDQPRRVHCEARRFH